MKLLTKVEDATSCKLSTINSETVAESRSLAVTTTLGHLRMKRDLIIKLDSDICDTILTEEELETELNDTDSYLIELEEKIAIVEEYVKKASQPPVMPKQDTHTLMSHPPSNRDMMAHSMPEIDVVKKPTRAVTDSPNRTVTDSSHHVSADDVNLPINTQLTISTTQAHSRLPKLTLPTFNENPLRWQTFWDSFTAAVDFNSGLSLIQKFSYLRAQLQGDTAHAISGLLTDDNYVHSVTLLRERFGQQHKLIDAHMEALLNVPAPSNNLTSLQSFYDTIQSHMRSLSTLGKTSDSYGTLLSSVILGKLSPDTKTRMARDHYDTEWTI